MKILAVDGNSIANRAFYGIRALTNKNGEYTNAIYGFLTTLNSMRKELEPDAIAVAFDLRAPTFRHLKYSEYKGTRKGMPPELAEQMPKLKELLGYLGIACVSLEGYEADDILGTFSRVCEETDDICCIATGDRDSLQLVSDKTNVRLASTKAGKSVVEIYDIDKVKEKYGVLPPQLIDVKAIQGDTSDNIPGAKGIGEKGAQQLIAEFGSVDYIYENIDNIDIKPKMKEKLLASEDMVRLSYFLGKINREVPIDTDLNKYLVKEIDLPKASAMMSRLGLFKLMENMNISISAGASLLNSEDDEPEQLSLTAEKSDEKSEVLKSETKTLELDEDYSIIEKPKAAEEYKLKELADGCAVLPMVEDEGKAVFLFETFPQLKKRLDDIDKKNKVKKPKKTKEEKQAEEDELERRKYEITSICFLIKDTVYFFKPDIAFLRAFAKTKAKKYSYDIKLFMRCLGTIDEIESVELNNPAFDVRLAAYLADPSASDYNVERLGAEYKVMPVSFGEDKWLENGTATLPMLMYELSRTLEKLGERWLFEKIEMPLSTVLADMETTGVEVNREGIEEFGKVLKIRIDELEGEIKEYTGDINVNSPSQLGTALFETMGLKNGKKTKTGYSTSADVLEEIRDEHPVIDKILEYRMLGKLYSTYCEGLVKVIAEDGRIHTTFNQTETRTGRISSTEPNLQNIPVRTELGAEMRKFFVAKEGYTFVDADYSQIELRVLAHAADDKVMIESFNSGKDIHRSTAARVFGMPEEMVTPKMRSSAKAVNFGIVYGIGGFSLAKDIGVSVREASKYIEEYLKNFSGVKAYMEKLIKDASDNGYSEDMFGRRRFLPSIRSSNRMERVGAERIARNMPIQGAAADIIKIAMIRVYERLKKEVPSAKLILQIHDELIVECREDTAGLVRTIVEEEMKNSAKLKVELKADANIGKDWYLAKG